MVWIKHKFYWPDKGLTVGPAWEPVRKGATAVSKFGIKSVYYFSFIITWFIFLYQPFLINLP